MITARDIMTKEVVSVAPATEITRAARLLLSHHINGLPVVDSNQKLVGILCQSDLIGQQKRLSLPSFFTFLDGFIPLSSMKEIEKEIEKVSATTVGQVMTPDPVTVEPDTDIHELASFMVEKNFHTLPVVDGGKLVGIVGKEDVLKTIVSEQLDS